MSLENEGSFFIPAFLACCPLCGTVPEYKMVHDFGGLRAYISCPACGLVLHANAKDGDDWAARLVNLWNMRSQALSPCPICGGKAVLKDHYEGYESWTTITCTQCGLLLSEGVEDGDGWRNRAIQKWNNRCFSDIRKYLK